MFTAAIILMEIKRPRGQRRCVHGINITRAPSQKNAAISMIRDLQIPGEHYSPSYSRKSPYRTSNGHGYQVNKTSSKIPSEHFCESLHTMHGNDQTGLVLVNQPPPNLKSTTTTTTTTTTAVVNPVPVRVPTKRVNDKDDLADEKEKEVDSGYITASEGRFHFGPAGGNSLDDVNFNLVNDFTRFPEGKLGQDGDRLATLHDEITMKKEKRRMVLEQILQLEEQKRRYIRNTHLNLRKIRDSRQKREKLSGHDAHAKVDRQWQQVIDLENEKVMMEGKLEKFEDIGLALAMQKEEKHRSLLEIIDSAPALYRKESENLEERQQREVVRYQVALGLFLALFAILLITYISRFGVTDKSATDGGMFY